MLTNRKNLALKGSNVSLYQTLQGNQYCTNLLIVNGKTLKIFFTYSKHNRRYASKDTIKNNRIRETLSLSPCADSGTNTKKSENKSVMCNASCVIFHGSPVTCHLSSVTCHLSIITCHLSPDHHSMQLHLLGKSLEAF